MFLIENKWVILHWELLVTVGKLSVCVTWYTTQIYFWTDSFGKLGAKDTLTQNWCYQEPYEINNTVVDLPKKLNLETFLLFS